MYALGHTMRHAFVSYEIGKACRYLLLALLFFLANTWYLTHTTHPTDQVLRISGLLTTLAWASGLLSGLILLWAGVQYWLISHMIPFVWDLFRELIAEKAQQELPHARATRDDA